MQQAPNTQELLERARRISQGHRESIRLPPVGSWPEANYQFEAEHLYALVTAMGAQRPILITGEPGCGKSDLVRAYAELLQRQFLSTIIQPLTEYQDLQWSIDHAARLGEVHMVRSTDDTGTDDKARESIATKNFISPGPLWFAINHGDAVDKSKQLSGGYQPEGYVLPADQETAQKKCANGTVLLIDEVDKASAETSNGLLEVLGNKSFSVPILDGHTVHADPKEPLMVLTSNGENALPPAVHRRCVRLTLRLPTGTALKQRLQNLAITHFWPEAEPTATEQTVLAEAAEQIVNDREAQRQSGSKTVLTGVSEYLDLIRALRDLSLDPDVQLGALYELAPYVLKRPD